MEKKKRINFSRVDIPRVEEGYMKYFEKSLIFTRDFYKEEFDRVSSTRFSEVTKDFFFKEYIWVVHATGFSASAVSKFIGKLLDSYGNIESLSSCDPEEAVGRVRIVCNNPQKIRSVHETSRILDKGIKNNGWEKFRDDNLSTPEKLGVLPYIGKVTRFHLARNIGITESVKPDLHLIRLQKHWGFESCSQMCQKMSDEHMEKTGEKIENGLVDLALWYAATSFSTISIRKEGDR
jgi:endonuclease III